MPGGGVGGPSQLPPAQGPGFIVAAAGSKIGCYNPPGRGRPPAQEPPSGSWGAGLGGRHLRFLLGFEEPGPAGKDRLGTEEGKRKLWRTQPHRPWPPLQALHGTHEAPMCESTSQVRGLVVRSVDLHDPGWNPPAV